jgi:hypothetical protein
MLHASPQIADHVMSRTLAPGISAADSTERIELACDEQRHTVASMREVHS